MSICPNCPKLWRVWYVLIVFGFNAYLIYSAILRYLEYKGLVFNQRYGGNWSHTPLNFYLSMIIAALTCLSFMMYAAIARVGNHANDNVVIGRDASTLKAALNEVTGRPGEPGSAWRRLRRHFLPLYGFLHVIAAFCLLLPLPLLKAEKIRYEVIKKNLLWHSDLDFLFHPDRQHTKYKEDGRLVQLIPVSPEMVNFVVALVHLTVRYPSTFWYSNRWFALLFSTLVFTASLHLISDHSATALLIVLRYNSDAEEENKEGGLSAIALILLHSLGTIVILCAQYTIFEYGYTQFLDNLKKYRQYFVAASDSSEDAISELGPSASSTTVASGTINRNKATVQRRRLACLQKYMPHILAAVFTCLGLATKGPLVWDCLRVYRWSNDSLCLFTAVIAVVYFALWIAAWFCFALKPSWHFQINIPIQTVSEITHTKGATIGTNISADASALYACFHDNHALNNSPDNTRPPSIDCCSDSSKASGHASRHNYVFLQSTRLPPPHIPTISEHVTNSEPGSQGTFDSRVAVPPPPPPPPTSVAAVSAEQRAGLLKYAVPPTGSIRSMATGFGSSSNCVDSAGSSMTLPTVMGASLSRNSKMRKSYNRVTFKEGHHMGTMGAMGAMGATIPGSPQSESTNNTMSSDSGIEGSRMVHHMRSLGRTDTPGSTYEDYQVLSNMFKEPTYYNQSDFVNYVDVYGPGGGPPPPPPPPTSAYDPPRVPDILQTQAPTPTGIRLGMAAVAGGRRSPLDSKSAYMGSLQRRLITTTPTPPPPIVCDEDDEKEEEIELTERHKQSLAGTPTGLGEESEQRLWSQV